MLNKTSKKSDPAVIKNEASNGSPVAELPVSVHVGAHTAIITPDFYRAGRYVLAMQMNNDDKSLEPFILHVGDLPSKTAAFDLALKASVLFNEFGVSCVH
jgi:hypothetical protein